MRRVDVDALAQKVHRAIASKRLDWDSTMRARADLDVLVGRVRELEEALREIADLPDPWEQSKTWREVARDALGGDA